MRRVHSTMKVTAVAVTCGLLCATVSLAGKPDNPGGGGNGGGNGGGGGGDSTSTRFSVIELPHTGFPMLSEAAPDGIVTVAIDSSEAGYVSTAYALVDQATGQVLESGFLPEPPFVDPNDGVMKNGWSDRGDVNVFGDIVGYAATFDPDATGDPSPARAILWTDDGDGYEYTLLPILPGYEWSQAFGTNNGGDIVGLHGSFPEGVAVLWHAATQTVVDLNTPAIADQGWELFVAYDINDDGLIVGDGYLDGVHRGYVLDPFTDTIWAVPLIGPAIGTTAYRINSSGRTVGSAYDGEYGEHYGTDPDFVQGYSWSGPGTPSIGLPSVTNNTCHAFGLNDFGATVGNSYIPTDDLFSLFSVPTLWEFAENGDVITTDLQTEVPSRPYTLANCVNVNNDLWIGARARKFAKGSYSWPAVILVPNN